MATRMIRSQIARTGLLGVIAAALLVGCNGEPKIVPVADTPGPASTAATVPTLAPTGTQGIEPTVRPPLETATPPPAAVPSTPQPATPPTAPTDTPTPTAVSTPTPAPTTDLVLEAAAEVSGYWSDGRANVDLTATVHNQGGLALDAPANIAVCQGRSQNVPLRLLMFSESVLANWPAEMSNSHHGECGFDSKGTDKTSGSEQFAR